MVTENYLQVLLLIFTLAVCIFMNVGILVAKFESEQGLLISRRRLLDQLGMRGKEQRRVLKKQVSFFIVLPIVAGLLVCVVFISIMGMLRFFSVGEWLEFGRLFLMDYSVYLISWGIIGALIYRRIEKWR